MHDVNHQFLSADNNLQLGNSFLHINNSVQMKIEKIENFISQNKCIFWLIIKSNTSKISFMKKSTSIIVQKTIEVSTLDSVSSKTIDQKFFNATNELRAIIGYLAGQITCVWIVIGGLVIKRPMLSLEVSTEGCPANTTYLEPGLLVSQLKDYRIPEYYPEGIAKIYHVSHFIIPAIGFLVSLIVGILFSLLTGCNRDKCVNPDLVLPCLRKYCCVKNDPKKCNQFKKHQMKQNDISETIPMKS
uniref:Uncharacterized protein n=1 Tax=Tetranychus urticae TaxID=32264 RepID=T1JYM9_TETUR